MRHALLIFLVALPLVPVAEAQSPLDVYDFQFTLGTDRVIMPGPNSNVLIPFTFEDRSKDSTAAGGSTPAGATSPLLHDVRFQFKPEVEDPGWIVAASPAAFQTVGGETKEGNLILSVFGNAQNANFVVNVTVIFEPAFGERREAYYTISGYFLGAEVFAAQPPSFQQVRPHEIFHPEIRIVNGAMAPRGFDVEVVSNPCDLDVGTQSNNIIPGRESGSNLGTVPVSIQAPFDKIWYFSELCIVGLAVAPTDNPEATKAVNVNIQVNGPYFDPVWAFWLLAIALSIFIIVMVVRDRKARIEEEILGKPQKPWTIPVEKLYLEKLKETDERAWYVVRHHLMEEEYRSALMWYNDFKRATKATRTKEAVIVKHEHRYEAWKKRQRKKVEAPLREADRYEAKLQRQIDKAAEKDFKKEHKKWEVLTKKLRAHHESKVEKANEKHQKALQRAAKKGLPEPEMPVIPAPDLPEEPKPTFVKLEDHKLAKKAAKFRAKMEKKHGNLDVRYEKKRLAYKQKVIRKVRRVARKLDDPGFIEEHPLAAE